MKNKITLTAMDIERFYGIPATTLANWRSQKVGPSYYKINRRVLYVKEEFEKWLFGNRKIYTTGGLEND